MKWMFCLSFSALLLCIASCGYSQPKIAEGLPVAVGTISSDVLGNNSGEYIIIKDTIDLGNRACSLPEGVSLIFKGGCLKNGTLIGNKTRLKSKGACFSRVRILGSWNVPVIKSSYFMDLRYDNSLKDVLALSDSLIKNVVIIDKGYYQVSALKNGDICLPIYSNTEVIINGEIQLTPNNFTNYYIINVKGSNIAIKGKGSIIGDKFSHTGTKGEWGMGINLAYANQVLVKGLTIKECWGDCIYVGSESSNVRIEKCFLDNGRRQGISITSADGVVIRNCTITNVNGTTPECAIDVEPNRDESVDNVKIENVTIINCRGGINAWGRAPGANIGMIEVNKCDISGCSKLPISIVKCSLAKVEKCTTRGFSWKKDIIIVDVDSAINRNNIKK